VDPHRASQTERYSTYGCILTSADVSSRPYQKFKIDPIATVSTLASRLFRLCGAFFSPALLAGTCHDAAADTVYQAPGIFLWQTFGRCRERNCLLDRTDRHLTKLIGHPSGRLAYATGAQTGKLRDLDESQGIPITAGFVVQTIASSSRTHLSRTRGMEIHFPSFLKQFVGAQWPRQSIPKIDGSWWTLSVWAMEHMLKQRSIWTAGIPMTRRRHWWIVNFALAPLAWASVRRFGCFCWSSR